VETAHESPAREYTIDELAAASEVPSRTIRFYQSKAVLPRPEMRGRVAYYGPAHVERLRLIASLQDRGLRIDAIRELVSRIDKGEVDVAEWLGLEAELQAPWANDQPRTVSEAELRELLGGERPGLVAALTRVGLVERQGSVFLLKSPALLSVAMRLDAAGWTWRSPAAPRRSCANSSRARRTSWPSTSSSMPETASDGAPPDRTSPPRSRPCGRWGSRPCG
jgi:DNA-binding transcriptional MerR regulator